VLLVRQSSINIYNAFRDFHRYQNGKRRAVKSFHFSFPRKAYSSLQQQQQQQQQQAMREPLIIQSESGQ